MPSRQHFTFSSISVLLAPPVVALSLSLGLASSALAAEFGRARVLSAQGSPLHVTVPVTGLTVDDDRVLTVRLADIESLSRAGLRPPARLNSMQAALEAAPGSEQRGKTPRQRLLRVTSTEPSTSPSVDLLLVVGTSTGLRLVQFSVLFPQPGLSRPSAPTQAVVALPRRASDRANGHGATATPAAVTQRADMAGPGSLLVRRGQTLSGVADAHPVTGADYYQRLVALWQANPDAFIDNNMNLLRAGERLRLPDANAVRAVDPADARRIYQQQLDAHAAYRARMGHAAGRAAVVTAAAGDRGQVEARTGAVAASATSTGDRLRLSDGVAGDAEGDRQAAERRALEDAAGRVDQLSRNVDELNRLSQVAGGGHGASETAAGVPQGGGAYANGAATVESDADSKAEAASTGRAASGGAAATKGDMDSGGDAASKGGALKSEGGVSSSRNGATAAGSATAGVSSPPRADDGADNKGNSSFMASSGLPAWLTDNLLIVVTAILAIIAFIIAWVVRRAAARNENDTGEDDETPALVDPALIDKRLSAIDLDLDTPPSDSTPGERQRR